METLIECSSQLPQMTAIYNEFIEHYMLDANGTYLKVYLYICKCIQNREAGLSVSSIADQMMSTDKDVIRALNFWVKKGLMSVTRNEDKEITSICLLRPSSPKTEEKESEESELLEVVAPATKSVQKSVSKSEVIDFPVETPAVEAVKPSGYVESSTEASQVAISVDVTSMVDAPSNVTLDTVSVEDSLARRTSAVVSSKPSAPAHSDITELTEDSVFQWLCNVIESYMSRTLKPSDMSLLAYLYQDLHFSTELIMHLYDMCIQKGKNNTRYIESIALRWHESGITTIEEAEQASTAYQEDYRAIARTFALNRALATVEKKYADRWLKEWEMDLAVVLEACNRTILKLSRPDFKYTDGILDHWHSAAIHTLQDVEKADALFQQKSMGAKKTTSTYGNKSANVKSGYNAFMQRGLSENASSELEKKLLNVSK